MRSSLDRAALDHVLLVARPSGGWPSVEAALAGSRDLADESAEVLITAGFVEGSARRHPGQGTANRRFFFQRFMFELLFVDDTAGLLEPRCAVLGLASRFTDPSASPVGLCTRPIEASRPGAAFGIERYQPAYLPSTLYIEVATGVSASDPLLFHLPFQQPADAAQAAVPDRALLPGDEPLKHGNGASSLTTLTLALPEPPAATARAILESLGVRLLGGSPVHTLQLGFDGESQGRRIDLSPLLPLSMRL